MSSYRNVPVDLLTSLVEDEKKLYYNSLINPSTLANDIRLFLLTQKYTMLIDKYKYIQELNVHTVAESIGEFLNQLHVRILIQGNMTGRFHIHRISLKEISKA